MLRELSRAARRWQRVPVRMAIVAGLLLLFVLALQFSNQSATSTDEVARLGRNLFAGSYIAFIFACAIVPGLLITQAVQSEREGGTLDLLSLTGISPSQVLWGLLGSRGLRAFLLLAGTAPLVALIPTLGGVGTGEAVAAFGALLAIFLTSTAVCGFLGIAARAMPVAIIAAVGWWLVVGVLAPIRLAVVHADIAATTFPVFLFPTAFAFEEGIDWDMGPGLIPWAVSAAAAVFVAGWRFRRGIETGWAAREKSWPGPWWGWVWHLPVQILGWGWLEWLYSGVADDYNAPQPLTSIEDITVANALMILLLTSTSILYLRAMGWLLPRLDLSRTWLRVPVIGDPILWRELLTNAQGGLSRGIGIATFAWAVIAVLLVVASGDVDALVPWGMVAAIGVVGLSVLLVVASVLEERRRRTLPLLVSTTMKPWLIVRGKLGATLLRLMPLVGLGLLAAVIAEPQVLGVSWTGGSGWQPERGLGARVLTSLPYARGFGLLLWCLGIWAGVSSLALWLAIAPRRRVVASALPGLLVVLVVFVLPFAGFALQEAPHRQPWLEELGVLLFPAPTFLRRRDEPGVAVGALISASVWWSLAGIGLGLATRSLRRVGTRRG